MQQDPGTGITHDKTAFCGDFDLFGCKVQNIGHSSKLEAVWGHELETRS